MKKARALTKAVRSQDKDLELKNVVISPKRERTRFKEDQYMKGLEGLIRNDPETLLEQVQVRRAREERFAIIEQHVAGLFRRNILTEKQAKALCFGMGLGKWPCLSPLEIAREMKITEDEVIRLQQQAIGILRSKMGN